MSLMHRFTEGELVLFPGSTKDFSLRTKLLITLIPSLILILLVTGYITYLTSHHFLNQALERTARIQVKAMTHEINSVIARSNQNLLSIAQFFFSGINLQHPFARLLRAEPELYCAIGYISQTDQIHSFLVAKENQIVQIPVPMISDINPDPLLLFEQLSRLQGNEIWHSTVAETEFPFPLPDNPNQKIRIKTISFGTPCYSEKGDKTGYLILYIDIRHLRNILSTFNSAKSPLWAFPRTPETRYAYLFDLEGWVLFQSEDPEKHELDLTTDLVRSNYKSSTLGKPGLPVAFQPASRFKTFWKMVEDVKAGKHDLIEMRGSPRDGATIKEFYLTYAPILFNNRVFAGIAYVDRTRFTLAAGYKHLDIMLILSISTIVAVSFIIFVLSHVITQPIYKLAEVVNDIKGNAELVPIDIRAQGYEANLLQNAINHLIEVANTRMAEIRRKELEIQTVEFKERIELKNEFPNAVETIYTEEFPEIVGFSPTSRQYKSELRKAANAEADVLIIGETGTGKQLAAEAIHRHSRRAENHFISVNCGELSESLLLDSLFGHIKGAFTEAKTDRKGAFWEAHGGTLFLDEIQTASPNVQQALLRAVAMRKIKPLGTDREIDVDVRLICATNVDLRLLIENQQFRSDLYFRLKVITIYTPALRDQKENIPVLVDYFLKQLRETTKREDLGISKGALEKMKEYNWPGNIRELMNCITRAAVMAENAIIQAEDILLENPSTLNPQIHPMEKAGGASSSGLSAVSAKEVPPHAETNGTAPTPMQSAVPQMNSRQEKVYSYLLHHRSITRNEYQQQVGSNVSTRTAIYDLQDLVKKGLLRKEGNGPATRYILMDRTDQGEFHVRLS